MVAFRLMENDFISLSTVRTSVLRFSFTEQATFLLKSGFLTAVIWFSALSNTMLKSEDIICLDLLETRRMEITLILLVDWTEIRLRILNISRKGNMNSIKNPKNSRQQDLHQSQLREFFMTLIISRSVSIHSQNIDYLCVL